MNTESDGVWDVGMSSIRFQSTIFELGWMFREEQSLPLFLALMTPG